ncbi:MAG: hypothetical protein ACK55Z_14575, partial [bacterium]
MMPWHCRSCTRGAWRAWSPSPWSTAPRTTGSASVHSRTARPARTSSDSGGGSCWPGRVAPGSSRSAPSTSMRESRDASPPSSSSSADVPAWRSPAR